MANRTVKDAKSIKGTNPQYLVEKIIRSRIYDSKYWKEECFALTAELLVDKAMELRFAGGVYGGNIKVTPFLCLILKMLQIQPEKEIIVEFIKNQDFKYVRVLGAFYLRLTGSSLDCYNYLEPLLNDYRKIRRQNREGVFVLSYVDEFVDELLREERSCDIILPRMQKRTILEENNQLQPRISVLEEDEDDDADDDLDLEESKEEEKKSPKKSSSKSSKDDSRRRGRSRSVESYSSGERRGRRDYDRDREKNKEASRSSDYRRKEKSRDEGHDRRDRDRHNRDNDRRSDKYGERSRGSGGGDRDYGKSRDESSRSYQHRDHRESDRAKSSRSSRYDY